MKVPAKLPQFYTQKALIIVTSRQKANFYFAFSGKISKLNSISVPKPHYFDREGFFVGRNRYLTYRSGSVYELSDKLIKNEFLPVFEGTLLDLLKRNDITHIYLFSPSHMISEVRNTLPYQKRNHIEMSFMGNYVAYHPIDLLRKIDNRLNKKVSRIRRKSISEEEKRILEEAKKAQEIYGRKI